MPEPRRQLYTCFLDFRGGSYISQVEADGVVMAAHCWALSLDVKAITGMGPAAKATLIRAMLDPSLTRTGVAGMANVWCLSVIVRGHLCLVNIVETSRSRATLGHRRTSSVRAA